MESTDVMYFIYFSVALLAANGIMQYRVMRELKVKVPAKSSN